MSKFIRLTFDNGEIWEIPVSIVAEYRAEWYADEELNRSDTPSRSLEKWRIWKATFDDEYEYTVNDNRLLKDWLLDNMDIDDIKDYMRPVSKPQPPLSLSTVEVEFVE